MREGNGGVGGGEGTTKDYNIWMFGLICPAAPETTMAQSAAYDVVVAVDIGSTFTKVAWSIARTAEQVVLLIADGQWANQGQVPTTILYKPSQHHRGDLEFAAFGREAIRMHSEGEKNWVLFSKFMMTLHSESVRMLLYCVVWCYITM